MDQSKLKAEELVDKFRKEIYKGVITSADFNPARDKARNVKAAQCALIAVDEIIYVIRTFVKRKNKSLIPKPIWEVLDFWIKVKEEINSESIN